MMRSCHALGSSLLWLLTGCASAAPSPASPPAQARHAAAAPAEPKQSARDLAIAITSSADHPRELEVSVVIEEAALARQPLRYRGAAARLSRLSLADARGALPHELVAEGPQSALELGRPAEGPLQIRYSVRLEEGSKRFVTHVLEPTELVLSGEVALLLPDVRDQKRVELSLAVGGAKGSGASSFAFGAKQAFRANTAELWSATYLAGDLGRAEFHAADGDDFTAWSGFTAFDARWAAAETASVRAFVDDYVGRAPDERRPVSMLIVPERRSSANLAVELGPRGLLVSADPRASWSPPVRLRVAQRLVQRYLGGALWVGDRDKPASGTFFSEGFSRAVALDSLSTMGIFDHADRAAEVNTLLTFVDLSPVGRASLDAIAAHPDEIERVGTATARGALAALLLHHQLARGGKSLRSAVRAWLVAAKGRDTLTWDELVSATQTLGGGGENVLAGLRAGGKLTLPKDLLGPCYTLKEGPVAPFELGLEVAAEGADLRVVRVTPGSNAAKAGIAIGELLKDLRYTEGRPDLPVELVLRGSGTKKTFMPAGKTKPGRHFARQPRVPDSAC